MDQIFLASQDPAVSQPIPLTAGTPVSATRTAAESHITAATATSWWESKRLTAKLTAHGLQRSFQFAFVSIVKSQVT